MVDGYAPVVSLRLVNAATVLAMFGKPEGWQARDHVRKALYARGFRSRLFAGAGCARRLRRGSSAKAPASANHARHGAPSGRTATPPWNDGRAGI